MRSDGEFLEADVRVVVSPAAGVFTPLDAVPPSIDVGTAVGFVHAGSEIVPVLSAFRGELVRLEAVAGERLESHQRVAWLRVA
jgi:[acyl-carrier-protein] S-malonyltransferase